jgi:outer membrane immunogenic protein
MMSLTRRFAVLPLLACLAEIAPARPDIPWNGGYLGVHLGDASSSTCNSWALNAATFDSTTASQFYQRECFTSSAFVGGVQLGENFQHNRLLWGVGADLDFWHSKERTQSLGYLGGVLPAGTYAYSSKENPSGFAVVGPRIGYAGDTWMPYLKAGAVINVGSHNSTFFYTPLGTNKPIASFSGGKDFSTTGWAAGGGIELGLNGAWSITAEYLHMSLGQGSDTTSMCSGTVLACAAFAGVTFNNTHEGFSANVFRVGVSYYFQYW